MLKKFIVILCVVGLSLSCFALSGCSADSSVNLQEEQVNHLENASNEGWNSRVESRVEERADGQVEKHVVTTTQVKDSEATTEGFDDASAISVSDVIESDGVATVELADWQITWVEVNSEWQETSDGDVWATYAFTASYLGKDTEKAYICMNDFELGTPTGEVNVYSIMSFWAEQNQWDFTSNEIRWMPDEDKYIIAGVLVPYTEKGYYSFSLNCFGESEPEGVTVSVEVYLVNPLIAGAYGKTVALPEERDAVYNIMFSNWLVSGMLSEEFLSLSRYENEESGDYSYYAIFSCMACYMGDDLENSGIFAFSEESIKYPDGNYITEAESGELYSLYLKLMYEFISSDFKLFNEDVQCMYVKSKEKGRVYPFAIAIPYKGAGVYEVSLTVNSEYVNDGHLVLQVPINFSDTDEVRLDRVSKTIIDDNLELYVNVDDYTFVDYEGEEFIRVPVECTNNGVVSSSVFWMYLNVLYEGEKCDFFSKSLPVNREDNILAIDGLKPYTTSTYYLYVPYVGNGKYTARYIGTLPDQSVQFDIRRDRNGY